VSASTEGNDRSLGDGGHSKDTETGKKRHRWRRNPEDVQRWVELFQSGVTIVHIANQENVDPDTVSQQLHKLGMTITPGHHMVEQLPLKYSSQFIELVNQGPVRVLDFVNNRVWGIAVTDKGRQQLQSFCEFVRLHQQGVGVEEIARTLSLHRSTVAEWREGTDQPYLVKAANDTLPIIPRTGWKLLPMHLSSGGNEPSGWIQIPANIQSYSDVLSPINQLRPLEKTYERAIQFELSKSQIDNMRPHLFAYSLGMMLGDSGKGGGRQKRFSSMNYDLHLSMKHSSNERLREFTSMSLNSAGLKMDRISDKPPTGDSLRAEEPTDAYRWNSERSPMIAWMFSAGLGLDWKQTTSTDQVRIRWIFDTPFDFRRRFVQAVADSDGTVRRYDVVITSVPNADLITELLRSLGLTSAHTIYESGIPLRTGVSIRQASELPIFNEYVKSYRYQKMMYLTKT
jgi:hypothetical protein